jgi:hypothetical protein
MHVAEHPDTSAQARRLANVLRSAGVPVRIFGVREPTHNKINVDLGMPDDPGTKALFEVGDEAPKRWGTARGSRGDLAWTGNRAGRNYWLTGMSELAVARSYPVRRTTS